MISRISIQYKSLFNFDHLFAHSQTILSTAMY